MAKTILIIITIFFIQPLILISFPRPANVNGFSVELIHRDSPRSPYYDPSLSHTQTLVNAIRRSLNRYHPLNVSLSSAGSTETDVVRSIHSGDYLMRYKIGQQEDPSLGILDTGGSLVWTQCFPCSRCIKQNPPLYEPGKSSTYKVISCNEFECNRSSYANMCRNKQVKACVYYSSYEEGTFTSGKLSKDTFILSSAGGTTTYVYDMVFGCSSRAQSNFYGYESGVIGLGRGSNSLVSQLRDSAKGKFSYCLVPKPKDPTSGSRMSFGESAEVSGEGVVRTPLVYKNGSSWYYVTVLMGKEVICILVTKSDRLWLPMVTLHFGGDNANVSFGRENMFVRTSPNSLCLAVLPAGDDEIVVLGYIAQANFVIGYDSEKNQSPLTVQTHSTECICIILI